jgi:putative peptide zinc metalloprotease protein
MSPSVSETLDLTQQTLRLAEDVHFTPVHQRGKIVYQIEVPSLHRFFRVGYEEYVFISLLDGHTTIPQACGLAAAHLGPSAPTASETMTIAKWLLDNELAYLPTKSTPRRMRSSPDRDSSRLPSWLRRMNPFWIKVPIPHCKLLMNEGLQAFRHLFSSAAVFVGILFCIATLVLAIVHRRDLLASATDLFLPQFWIGMVAIWVLLKIIHELAHAAACKRYGIQVKEAGIVFVLLAPLAYVDVSGSWRLTFKVPRLAIAAAGMYVELLIASVAMMLWTLTDSDITRFVLYQIMVAAGLSTVIFNANVLMRFDGYFILADMIDVPNLATESKLAVQRLLSRVVTGKPSLDGGLGSWRRHFVLVYGVSALIWQTLVCVSLLIAASKMFAGAGILLALLGTVLWSHAPLRKFRFFLQSQLRNDFFDAVRPIGVSVCLIVGLFALIFGVKIPSAIRVPSVIEYLPETTLRSQASGYLKTMHAKDGDLVGKGDRLLDIENRELRNRLETLDLTWRQTEIKLRQSTEAQETDKQHVLRQHLESLEQQLKSLQTQVNGLTIYAPRDGQVVAPTLAARIGDYVGEGEGLLIVAGSQDKHLVAVIDQEQLEEAREYLGREVQIRSVGFSGNAGTLTRIEPRATDRLPSPSMAATEGGSIAVRRVDEATDGDSMRMILPAFRGRVDLTPQACEVLPAGLRVTTVLGYRSETLAFRWKRSIDELWYQFERDE